MVSATLISRYKKWIPDVLINRFSSSEKNVQRRKVCGSSARCPFIVSGERKGRRGEGDGLDCATRKEDREVALTGGVMGNSTRSARSIAFKPIERFPTDSK
jgi:hypothetical protein